MSPFNPRLLLVLSAFFAASLAQAADVQEIGCGKLKKLDVPSYRVRVSTPGLKDALHTPISVKVTVWEYYHTIDWDDMNAYSHWRPQTRLEATYDPSTDEYVTPAIHTKFENHFLGLSRCRDTFMKVDLQINADEGYWISPNSRPQTPQNLEFATKDITVISGDDRGRVIESSRTGTSVSVELGARE